LLRYDLTQTVFDLETAAVLSTAAGKAGKKLKIHIKADTGMSRLGILCDEESVDASVETIAAICALPYLEHEGIFTHFSVADTDEEYTMRQFTRFLTVLDKLKVRGITFPIRHCAASAAVLNYPCTHLDMVRPGIALYGHYPAEGMEPLCSLLPVMELKTRVIAIRTLPAGSSVSYGRTHVLQRDSSLAVLPIGYADGFFRQFSDKLEELVHGKKARLSGRVCMDLCMVDVTDIPDVKRGDVVTVYGFDGDAFQPVEEGAKLVGTIQYELLCAVSQRIPRVYI
jgi:alanine racemase